MEDTAYRSRALVRLRTSARLVTQHEGLSFRRFPTTSRIKFQALSNFLRPSHIREGGLYFFNLSERRRKSVSLDASTVVLARYSFYSNH